jgi:transposase
MFNRFQISDEDWQRTPATVQQAFTFLYHQFLLLEVRSQAYEHQLDQLREQVTQIDDLKAEMAELRERLGQNSSNSSKPPSSDPPQQHQPIERQTRGRKRGGQVGHPGKGRKLKAVAQVDYLIDLRPTSCLHCGSLLLGDDPQPARHQVSDLPVHRALVTEYRRHTLKCLSCGAANRASWPTDMPRGSFGPRTQAVGAYLSGRLHLSHRDVVEALEVLHGVKLSLGSVSARQRQVSAALAGPVQTAQGYVQRQPVNHVDETSWYQQDKLHWLWLAATEAVTVFRLLAGRGSAQAKQVISKSARGIIITDRYNAYNWLPLQRRQLCWAHLKRDFQAMAEREGESAEIGQGLLEQTRELCHLWHQRREGQLRQASWRRQIKVIEQEVKKLLIAGTESGHAKTRHTCANILQVEPCLWTFARREGIEPTNNNAERALRRAVLWRKKSFGTQSETGSRFVERILTVVTSLRQQGRDVLDYLTAACSSGVGNSHMSLSLLPEPP